ncbi:MAG: hypothetical protein A2231_05955 [Candidatus Firestonebacteria bacterium RIFOXYA2_FULL_40_8]|nr:MAG: hypothetical protein A2231_05955 [Candidatus Firestonebacteria bacterium RIFOXYA2_FULL_40_8]
MAFSKAKDFVFMSKVDGSSQRYIELLPEGFQVSKMYDLMVALHGHDSDRNQYASDERGECKGARDTASKYNMIYISPDYRAKTSWMGPKAEADVLQILQELKTKYKIGKVIFVGGSMGGTSALIFSSLHPDLVAGVSAQNPCANMIEYDNFQEFIANSYGGTKKELLSEYQKRSSELNYKNLTMPVAITTGGKDTIVPPESALRLANLLRESNPGNVLLIHRKETAHETNYSDTVEAIEFVIAKTIN